MCWDIPFFAWAIVIRNSIRNSLPIEKLKKKKSETPIFSLLERRIFKTDDLPIFVSTPKKNTEQLFHMSSNIGIK